MDDDFWKAVQEKEQSYSTSRKTGALNIALLFGTAPERVKEQIGRLKTALAEQQKWAESYQGFRI